MKRTYIATTQEAKALHDGTQTAIISKMRVQPKDCSHIHRITDELCEWRNEPQRMDTYGNYIACSFCGYGIEISGEYMFPIPYAIGQEVVVREKCYQIGKYKFLSLGETGDYEEQFCTDHIYHFGNAPTEPHRVIGAATMPVSAARTRFIPVSCEAVRVRDVTAYMILPLLSLKSIYNRNIVNLLSDFHKYATGKLGQSAWDNNDYIFYYKIEKV